MSLLNTDYKILSKILSNRLRKVIDNILPIQQLCGAPNRKMDDILLTIDSIYQMTQEEETGGAIICVDQEKAFDRVNHKFLFTILEEIGFDGNFL